MIEMNRQVLEDERKAKEEERKMKEQESRSRKSKGKGKGGLMSQYQSSSPSIGSQ
jgi:hypothetical protein